MASLARRLVVCLVLAGCQAGEALLDPSAPLEREMAAGEVHTYALLLDTGEYVQVIVEQKGIDVIVTVRDPNGTEMLRVDSPNDVQGPEPVYLVADTPGRYGLEVRSSAGVSPGRYEIRTEARLNATWENRQRAAAAQAFAEGHNQRRGLDYRAALESYARAARSWEAAVEQYEEARAIYWTGEMHKELGDAAEALRSYQLSLERFRESGSEEDERIVGVHARVGETYQILGDLENAWNAYEQQRLLARKLENRLLEASALNNLGHLYKAGGDPQTGLDFYHRAVELWKELGNLAEEARTQANMSALLSCLGRHEEGRDLSRDALQKSRAAADRRVEAAALRSLGEALRRHGQLDEALRYLEQLLVLRQELGDRAGEAVARRELAGVYFRRGDLDRALRQAEATLEYFKTVGNPKEEASILTDLGRIQVDRDPRRALELAVQARERFRQAGIRSRQAAALYVAALAQQRLGAPGAGRTRVEEALEIVESLRTRLEVLDLRSSYLANKQDYYELYIDLLADLHELEPAAGYDALAFEASERRRSRTLLDVLNKATDRPVSPWRDSRGGETFSPGDRPFPTDFPQWDRPGRKVSFELQEQLRLHEVRQLLDDDTLLLEYSLGEARSFLWLVTPTELRFHELPGRSEIEKLVRDLPDLYAQPRRGRGRRQLLSAELSHLLFGPVAEHLSSRRIFLVSDEKLLLVPFAALPLPRAHPAAHGEDEPMITQHEIIRLPSLPVLAALRRQIAGRPAAEKLIAVVADPVFGADDPRVPAGAAPRLPPLSRLLASRAEAEAILALAPPGESLQALGFAADPRLVRNGELTSYRIIHFATHSRFDPDDPEATALVLSRLDEEGRPRDGLLSSYEIYGLDLPVEMVVLSACRTGLGRPVRGEGLVGLTQSFLYAGATRVVASLWPVDDEGTAALMERFYEGIFEGLRPAAALRAAQLRMRHEKRWQSPYFWAGFFIAGSGDRADVREPLTHFAPTGSQ